MSRESINELKSRNERLKKELTEQRNKVAEWEEWYKSISCDYVGVTDNQDDPTRTVDWEWLDGHCPHPVKKENFSD